MTIVPCTSGPAAAGRAIWTMAGLLFLATILCASVQEGKVDESRASAPPAGPAPSPRPAFQDEAAAHALYDRMIAAMRAAKTLSYQSDYAWEARGRTIGHAIYTVRLKKPNFFRVDAVNCDDRSLTGVIIGDGDFLWLHWPNRDRPRFYPGDTDETYAETRTNAYMKERTPLAKHSIGHKTGYLGVGMSMPILDPSTFHGYTSSLDKYIDGIRSLGSEVVDGEECVGIEVSIMKGQRSWELWLATSDWLPRKLNQIVRVSYDIVMRERWSNVLVNVEIPEEEFSWQPPEGWKQWRPLRPEQMLLKPGTPAPDFELKAVGGGTIRLSSLRGQVVWLYIWRGG